MHALWIDEGSDANYAKLRAYEIDEPFYALRDPRVTKRYLQQVRIDGFAPGVYVAPEWYPPQDGKAFAETVSGIFAIRFPATGSNFPKVCVDIETHDVDYIRDFFNRWRELRPTRVTDWTLEGMQGGLFDTGAVAEIVAANVGIAPQFYKGNMTAQPHSVILDLTMAGFPIDRIIGMYDAAALPYRWNGYAFTQGRLP